LFFPPPPPPPPLPLLPLPPPFDSSLLFSSCVFYIIGSTAHEAHFDSFGSICVVVVGRNLQLDRISVDLIGLLTAHKALNSPAFASPTDSSSSSHFCLMLVASVAAAASAAAV